MLRRHFGPNSTQGHDIVNGHLANPVFYQPQREIKFILIQQRSVRIKILRSPMHIHCVDVVGLWPIRAIFDSMYRDQDTGR